MHKLVLLRHGQSTWNLENRFTGWTDVDLTDQGCREAEQAGLLLAKEKFRFDIAYTSFLTRAVHTLWIALDAMDQVWVPVSTSWRLNERHYGALQGLNKAEMTQKYGAEQVKLWRRGFDIPPPPLPEGDARFPGEDLRYACVPPVELPRAESLKDTIRRFMPLWEGEIAPRIRQGERFLVCAHGNSLRALVMELDQMAPEAIVELNIPTGIPLVYELDNRLKPLRHYYLGDPEAAKRAAETVAKQADKK